MNRCCRTDGSAILYPRGAVNGDPNRVRSGGKDDFCVLLRQASALPSDPSRFAVPHDTFAGRAEDFHLQVNALPAGGAPIKSPSCEGLSSAATTLKQSRVAVAYDIKRRTSAKRWLELYLHPSLRRYQQLQQKQLRRQRHHHCCRSRSR